MANTTWDQLELLEQTQGTNAKVALLSTFSDNELLKEVFRLTSDPYTNFFIAKVPKVKNSGGDGSFDSCMNDLLEAIKICSTREVTGNAARDTIVSILLNMTDLEIKWAARIITRKLRIGVGDSGIEKVWPGLVKSFKMALADKVDWQIDNGKLKILTPIPYPCRVEPKWDGFRCIAIKANDVVTLYARSGKIFDRAPAIQSKLEKIMPNNFVFDGEIIGSNNWNDTAEILSSRVNYKDDSSLQYHVFDCLPFESWSTQGLNSPFSDRRMQLCDWFDSIEGNKSPIILAEGQVISNEIEMHKYYEECLKFGYEGIMVKNLNEHYHFKRSDALLKLKPIVDYDCVVVDVEKGREETKWAGIYTILHVRLPEGGKAITRVGTGTSDEEKHFINENRLKLVGKACTIQGQPPLSEEFRIRFPRFLKWREEWDCSPEVRKLIDEVKYK